MISITERARSDERILRAAESTVTRICDEYAHALDERHSALVEDYLIVEIQRFRRASMPRRFWTIIPRRSRACYSASASCCRHPKLKKPYGCGFPTTKRFDDRAVGYGLCLRSTRECAGDRGHLGVCQLPAARAAHLRRAARPGARRHLQDAARRSARSLRGRREAEQAATLRYLIVDVLELTDRSSNALKVVGDAYYARIYRSAAMRLGLADWQRHIDTKLASLGDMYRFFSDEARSRRDEFLEVTIVVLVALEVIIGILTLLHF